MTGQPLDFALVGAGFFGLDDGSGNLKYTRNGNFTISVEGNRAYLVSRLDGSYVLDAKGREISLTRNEGESTYDLTDVIERLGVFNTPNPYGMERAEGSCLRATDKSGPARSIVDSKNGPEYEIRGGTLENSSVDLGTEMLNVIQAQRAYQLNSKIVQTADQIEEMVNNLR